MKNLFGLLIILTVSSCSQQNHQEIAQAAIGNYIKDNLPDPSSYESVDFQPLDSVYRYNDIVVINDSTRLLNEQIENDDMPVEKAAEINNTVNTAVKLLDYELKRSAAMCNQEFRMRHRNLELKGFDSIPEPIRALPENAGG